MRRTAAEAEETRRSIIATARASFTSRGYAATSTTDLVESIHLTRGALYHHFADKEALFETVFMELVQELDDAVTGAATAAAPKGVRAAIVAGALACIEFMDRVDYRQIVVVDAPAVLGLDRWHQIDDEAGLHTMEQALELLAAEGDLEVPVNSALVRALFGALTELSLAHARGELTTADAIGAFELVLDRLGPNASPPARLSTARSSTKRKTAVQ